MFSVRCWSEVRGPRVRSHRDGIGRVEHCGRLGKRRFLNPLRPCSFVGPTPVGALSHGSGLDGNDPLPRHISGISFIIMSRNGRSSLVLGDDHSLIGGSDDMKSDVNIVEIGQFGGLHIYVSGIGHGFVH